MTIILSSLLTLFQLRTTWRTPRMRRPVLLCENRSHTIPNEAATPGSEWRSGPRKKWSRASPSSRAVRSRNARRSWQRIRCSAPEFLVRANLSLTCGRILANNRIHMDRAYLKKSVLWWLSDA